MTPVGFCGYTLIAISPAIPFRRRIESHDSPDLSDRDRRDLYIRGRAGRSAADRAVRPGSKAQRQQWPTKMNKSGRQRNQNPASFRQCGDQRASRAMGFRQAHCLVSSCSRCVSVRSKQPKHSVIDRDYNERRDPAGECDTGRILCRAAHCTDPPRGGGSGPTSISAS
jgi:hypothetical protein